MEAIHTASTTPGAPHLARRGAMVGRARALLADRRVLIADDNAGDVKYLATTLGIISGHGCEIITAPSLKKTIEAIQQHIFALAFLDDRMSGIEKFEHSMPKLRAAGYPGPVIVVCGFISPDRRRSLFELGAVDAIHKDDLEGLRISEAIVRAMGCGPGETGQL